MCVTLTTASLKTAGLKHAYQMLRTGRISSDWAARCVADELVDTRIAEHKATIKRTRERSSHDSVYIMGKNIAKILKQMKTILRQHRHQVEKTEPFAARIGQRQYLCISQTLRGLSMHFIGRLLCLPFVQTLDVLPTIYILGLPCSSYYRSTGKNCYRLIAGLAINRSWVQFSPCTALSRTALGKCGFRWAHTSSHSHGPLRVEMVELKRNSGTICFRSMSIKESLQYLKVYHVSGNIKTCTYYFFPVMNPSILLLPFYAYLYLYTRTSDE